MCKDLEELSELLEGLLEELSELLEGLWEELWEEL
jgi:hypothetical protein